jgi:hypothetical protein
MAYVGLDPALGGTGSGQQIKRAQSAQGRTHFWGRLGMDSEMIADVITLDIDRPRRGLVATLSFATITVWAFAAMSTLHASMMF